MKQLITMIVAACAFLAASAQHPMITLSHDGELSFFTSIGAFKAAVDSAQNGDVLYLSEGNFMIDGGKITIRKAISIVGQGYSSHIMGTIVHAVNTPIDSPIFDGLKIDNLEFSTLSDGYAARGDREVVRCWIKELIAGGAAGQNVLYDKCYIEKANFDDAYKSNVLVKNSKMGEVTGAGGNMNNVARINVINCNINKTDLYPRNMISSILNSTSSTYDHPSLINCLIKGAFPSNATIENCYNTEENLLNEKLECVIDLSKYSGYDGKEVGIMGGDSPFSENPSMPSVDTAKSSVVYDAENNKLKVNITVKAD